MTQKELADRVEGVSQVRVSQLEHGKVPMRDSEARLFADVLGVQAQQLYLDYVRWVSMEPMVGATETALAARKVVRMHSPILKRAKATGMNMQEVCDKAGICLSTAYNYASNPEFSSIRLSVIDDLARVLGCPFLELVQELKEWQDWFSGVPVEEMMVQGSLFQEKLARKGRL